MSEPSCHLRVLSMYKGDPTAGQYHLASMNDWGENEITASYGDQNRRIDAI
jgi:hypothetical protein